MNSIEINRILEEHLNKDKTPIVHLGILSQNGLGNTLLKLLYTNVCNNNKILDSLRSDFEKITLLFYKHGMNTSFYSGLSGAGWFIDYITKNNLIELDSNSFLSQLDFLIYKNTIRLLHENNHDFLYGAIGNMIYLIERIESAKNENRIIELVTMLKSISLKNSKGEMYWNDTKSGGNKVDLGLAHGMAGKIVLLCKIIRRINKKTDGIEMLRRSIDFMLSAEQNSKCGSMFPAVKILGSTSSHCSRLGWCYGDLAIGIAFWQASQVLNDYDLMNRSINIFMSSISRFHLTNTNLIDGGICHGYSGVALLYFRMYLNTKQPEFKKASEFWMNKNITLLQNDPNYKSYDPIEAKWSEDSSLLSGASGVLLSIFSISNARTHTWDSCLLMN